MIDSCYQDFDFGDALKILGVHKSDSLLVNRVMIFVNELFERNVINWKVLPDQTIFKRCSVKNVFKPETVMGDMIAYAEHSEKIY